MPEFKFPKLNISLLNEANTGLVSHSSLASEFLGLHGAPGVLPPESGQWLVSAPVSRGPKNEVVLYFLDSGKFKKLLETFLNKHAYSWVYAFKFGHVFPPTFNSSSAARCQYNPDWVKPEWMSIEQWLKQSAQNIITEWTPLDIGSVSKTISAVAMLRVLREANVSLDSEIHPWLPNVATYVWPKAFGKVTFRMLLSHTSGVPSNDGNWWKDDVGVYSAVPLPAPFLYSNSNYDVLRYLTLRLVGGGETKADQGGSLAVDNHAGQTFTNFIRNLMKPLGLSPVWGPSSSLGVVPFVYTFPRVNGVPGRGYKPFENLDTKVGPSAMFLSATDLLRFIDNVYAGSLLTDAESAELNANAPKAKNYGLGVQLYPEAEQLKSAGLPEVFFPVHYSHSGDASYAIKQSEFGKYFARARWVCVKEVAFQAVVLSNCCDGLDGPNALGISTELRRLMSDWFNLSITKAVWKY